MLCRKCGARMFLFDDKLAKNRKWWGCSHYPKCTNSVSAHPDGRVLSSSADVETRMLRITAHKELEKIFYKTEKTRKQRNQMYAWLKKNTRTGHVGFMNKDELKWLIEKLKIKQRYESHFNDSIE